MKDIMNLPFFYFCNVQFNCLAFFFFSLNFEFKNNNKKKKS